jgi:hypothetical protein
LTNGARARDMRSRCTIQVQATCRVLYGVQLGTARPKGLGTGQSEATTAVRRRPPRRIWQHTAGRSSWKPAEDPHRHKKTGTLPQAPHPCEDLLCIQLQGRADARRRTCGQAAADLTREPSRRHLWLERPGQRQPDRRTAYGPPPLIKSAALSARECRKPDGSGARIGGTMTARATASAGNDGGRSAPGASAKAAPCRAVTLRARRADAWQALTAPLAGSRSPLRVHRHRRRVRQRLTRHGAGAHLCGADSRSYRVTMGGWR